MFDMGLHLDFNLVTFLHTTFDVMNIITNALMFDIGQLFDFKSSDLSVYYHSKIASPCQLNRQYLHIVHTCCLAGLELISLPPPTPTPQSSDEHVEIRDSFKTKSKQDVWQDSRPKTPPL